MEHNPTADLERRSALSAPGLASLDSDDSSEEWVAHSPECTDITDWQWVGSLNGSHGEFTGTDGHLRLFSDGGRDGQSTNHSAAVRALDYTSGSWVVTTGVTTFVVVAVVVMLRVLCRRGQRSLVDRACDAGDGGRVSPPEGEGSIESLQPEMATIPVAEEAPTVGRRLGGRSRRRRARARREELMSVMPNQRVVCDVHAAVARDIVRRAEVSGRAQHGHIGVFHEGSNYHVSDLIGGVRHTSTSVLHAVGQRLCCSDYSRCSNDEVLPTATEVLRHPPRDSQVGSSHGSVTESDDVYPEVYFAYKSNKKYKLAQTCRVIDMTGMDQVARGEWLALHEVDPKNRRPEDKHYVRNKNHIAELKSSSETPCGEGSGVPRGGARGKTAKAASPVRLQTADPFEGNHSSPADPGETKVPEDKAEEPPTGANDPAIDEFINELDARWKGTAPEAPTAPPTPTPEAAQADGPSPDAEPAASEEAPGGTPAAVVADCDHHTVRKLYVFPSICKLISGQQSFVNFCSSKDLFFALRGYAATEPVVVREAAMETAMVDVEVRAPSDNLIFSAQGLLRLAEGETEAWDEAGRAARVIVQARQYAAHLDWLAGVGSRRFVTGCLNCRVLVSIPLVFVASTILLVLWIFKSAITGGSRALTRLAGCSCLRAAQPAHSPVGYSEAETRRRRLGIYRLVGRASLTLGVGLLLIVPICARRYHDSSIRRSKSRTNGRSRRLR